MLLGMVVGVMGFEGYEHAHCVTASMCPLNAWCERPNWTICALHGLWCIDSLTDVQSGAWHILHTRDGKCYLLIPDVFTQDMCHVAGYGGGCDGI